MGCGKGKRETDINLQKRKKWMLLSWIALGSVCAVSAGLFFTGRSTGWGPFGFLQFDRQEKEIIEKYNVTERQQEVVFYGASNFRLWTEMENDLAEYRVQNHGFGGSTDRDLVERADTLLYPYHPLVVFFQTGSNDYVAIQGTKEEKVEQCMRFKETMFETFHEMLPDAKFVVMSGLLLPGRSQYTELTMKVNDALAGLCARYDYMVFIDAQSMTFDGEAYGEELFVSDGIHLNRDGQRLWCESYIRPALEELIEKYDLQGCRAEGLGQHAESSLED